MQSSANATMSGEVNESLPLARDWRNQKSRAATELFSESVAARSSLIKDGIPVDSGGEMGRCDQDSPARSGYGQNKSPN